MSLSGLISKTDFPVRRALPGGGGQWGRGPGAHSLGVWVSGGGVERGAKGEACPNYGVALGSPPAGQARDWRLVRAIWAKAGEKLRCGNPTRGGLPGWGRREPGAVAAATPQRSPRGQPDTRLSFPFRLSPLPPASLPQCPAHLAAGRGAPQEGRRGGSGAALAHAPGPGAVQLPRPQLALLRARPCTSLLNGFGGGASR